MRIAILHASAGHGHAKIAEAVREGFIALGVSPKDILLLDALDETPSWFKHFYTSTYYYSVKHTPHAWGATYELVDHRPLYQILIRPFRRWVNHSIGKKLIHRMAQENPEVIVCTHFLAPEILGEEKRAGKLKAFLLALVTDFFPHTFWVNPGTDHYWVMSEEGGRDLESRGVSPARITAGGIPVSLRFVPHGKKEETRQKLGLETSRFTLLITSGSFGLGPAVEVLEALREFGKEIQVLVVCGKNEHQELTLKKKSYPFHARILGFVDNMDELMEASDLLVAKPGGSTTTESLAKEVPMVVLEPIPGQEARNARLLKARNAAFFLGEPSDIKIILKGILDYPEMLEEKKRSLQRLAKPEAAIDLARFVLNEVSQKKSGHPPK